MKEFLIHMKDYEKEIKLREGESLLKGVTRMIPSHKMNGCRGGGCGICKVKILAGDYERKKVSSSVISEEEIKRGYYLACKLYPKSDIEFEYIGKANKI